MTELLSAAQMRAIEQAAINSGAVTGLELMERAGSGVVEAVFEEWSELAAGPHKAVVLCGPGNNGGDGFVVARLLKDAGWKVEVFLYGDADKLPPDARVNCERWEEMGEVAALNSSDLQLWDCDLVIDALFGTGLTRPLEGEAEYAAKTINKMVWESARICSVDAPSGLCMDSGNILVAANGVGVAFFASMTVTFSCHKRGQILSSGPGHCGGVRVADIGLPWHVCRRALAALYGISPPGKLLKPYVSFELSKPETYFLGKKANLQGHKFTHGHALILSGPSGKGGAARLAARGALRIGAGVVSVGCPGDALAENAAQLDAIMLAAIHDGDALVQVLQDTRINALCLGPGLGHERAREMVQVALRAGVKPRPTVLDADALSAFKDAPEVLFEMLQENCVLTPHAGEFARLFPDIAEKLTTPATKGPAYSKVDATRDAAKCAGCVVLFKGADTVIAAPDGRCSVNSAAYERAVPWLATAGSGDVLAGFITGLLARGFAPMQAAETAAWLHVECALSYGPGLIAEDLPEELPKVFRDLGV